MAFLNRVGKLLKQNLSKHVNSELSASKPSLFQAIRNMSSSSKLFVGGLSYSTDEMSLRDAFAKYGDVVEARVILDRDTGRSRGFGFVTYTSSEAASSAIQAFDGQELQGRRIRVNYATERSRGGGFGGGFGTGGGGYNYGDQGGNYGSGGYQGGSYGGSAGGNYPGGGGNYNRDGGFSSGNQYPSGGGGFGGGNQFPSGGGGFGGANNYPSGGGSSSYGGDDVQDDGNYGGSGSGSRYSGSSSGFSSLLDKETTGTYGKIQEPPVGDDDDGMDEDFGQDSMDKIDKDDNDEPNDYANTRN